MRLRLFARIDTSRSLTPVEKLRAVFSRFRAATEFSLTRKSRHTHLIPGKFHAMRFELTRIPVKCPACGHRPLAPILYGHPGYDSEIWAKVERGEIILGGCCEEVGAPAWACGNCGQEIHRKRKIKRESKL